MAKRKSDSSGLIILFVIIGAIFSAAIDWVKANQEIAIGGVALVISLLIFKFFLNHRKYKKWVEYLKSKYNNDMDVVNGILNQEFWKGQSSEQLEDSLGSPRAIDKQVLKTKTKEVWKYHKVGKGQYALKITLEQGLVVAWDMKQ
ncbi:MULTISPECIES: hypothetical protein [Methylomonas]|uniref:hypothetical protein n=1 Tax=Methylomonas TaxID=416 RepID=UPI0007C9D766|nr:MULTISPECIES: hypothetical protein [Methylomonas]ANE54517.1 hypothetical protein AYM39_04495 [Methylomonas sp. DH-1]WNB76820.1 hypothetical protein RI210_04420 [Methylomonas koyamae]